MKCTRGQIEEFKRSRIRDDLRETLDFWIEGVRDQLENPTMEDSHRMLDRYGGTAEALRRVKSELIDSAMLLIEDQNDAL